MRHLFRTVRRGAHKRYKYKRYKYKKISAERGRK
jgi:hypothetical protein